MWRVTHLLWGEDGPADVFVRLHRVVRRWPLGRVFDCFYCLSVWVAAPVALWLTTPWIERALVWLGLSGGAILLERVTSRSPPQPPPAVWRHEPLPEEETDDVLLR